MKPDVIARASYTFCTTKPLSEGVSIRLSMISGVVRQSSGQERIYLEVGAGRTMCLYLPRHMGAATVTKPFGIQAIANMVCEMIDEGVRLS